MAAFWSIDSSLPRPGHRLVAFAFRLRLAVLMTCVAASSVAAQADVISRQVSVKVLPTAPVDVISRQVSVKVLPSAPVDVISRQFSVDVPFPDLVASLQSYPTAPVAGSYIDLSYAVSILQGTAHAPWTDIIGISTDQTRTERPPTTWPSVPARSRSRHSPAVSSRVERTSAQLMAPMTARTSSSRTEKCESMESTVSCRSRFIKAESSRTRLVWKGA